MTRQQPKTHSIPTAPHCQAKFPEQDGIATYQLLELIRRLGDFYGCRLHIYFDWTMVKLESSVSTTGPVYTLLARKK